MGSIEKRIELIEEKHHLQARKSESLDLLDRLALMLCDKFSRATLGRLPRNSTEEERVQEQFAGQLQRLHDGGTNANA